MFRAVAIFLWVLVVVLVLVAWALKQAVITLTTVEETEQPLWMGVSPPACKHLMDVNKSREYFECMNIAPVKNTTENTK